MRMPSRGFAVCLAVAMGGLGVAGCTNGKDDPTPSPTTSTSISVSSSPSPSSESPSPSPSPSVSIPAEAMQQTPEGAVAFVKFYFDQVNQAYMTPDARLIPPLGETECKSCEALQANAVEYVNLRHRYTTKSAELLNVAAVEGGAEGQQMVSFSLHQIQADLVDANGQVVTTTTDETYERKALLTWKEGRWSMLGIA